DRPLDLAGLALALVAAGERLGRDGLDVLDALGEEVGEPVRETEHRLGRGLVVDAGGIALPADLDAADEGGLGAGHAVEPGRLEGAALAEDHRVGGEGDRGSLLAGRGDLLDRAERLAAGERLAPLEAVLPGGDLDALGERVDDRDTDAVQAAGGLV